MVLVGGGNARALIISSPWFWTTPSAEWIEKERAHTTVGVPQGVHQGVPRVYLGRPRCLEHVHSDYLTDIQKDLPYSSVTRENVS